jgi:hypothetical protein
MCPIEHPICPQPGFGDRCGCVAVLLRLAYLAVTNGLAMLRLLPMSDRASDVEILALRHQIGVEDGNSMAAVTGFDSLRPTAYRAVGTTTGVATGSREQHVGLPAHPR